MMQRIKELDSLRGIAALFVVFFHFTLGRPEAQLGFKLGITGVDLFFIISGFVIFMSIQKTSSGLEFMVNRFTRLYPTYWTCVTITALPQLLWFFHSSENPTNLSFTKYIANLTMFQHYFKIEDIDGPYWTLIIEMLFYLFIFLLITIKKTKYILQIGLGLLIMVGSYSIFLENDYPSINSGLIYWFHLFTHFPLFMAGIIFYKIINKEGEIYLNYLFLIFCFIVQLNLFDNLSNNSEFISYTEYMMMLGMYFSLFILFVNHKLGYIVSKPTLFFGKISFALYLIHQFISAEIIIPFLLNHVINSFWIASGIALIICICVASAITYFIEIPIGKKMNRGLRIKLNLPAVHS